MDTPNPPNEVRYEQSAVIPYRFVGSQLELLLITTLQKKRWTIPKGLIEAELGAAASACQEAWEEAGVTGQVSSSPVGS
jgi:phosphohistidine phosphatase